jgi:hypothetical protein
MHSIRLGNLSDAARDLIVNQANGVTGLAKLLTAIDGSRPRANPSTAKIAMKSPALETRQFTVVKDQRKERVKKASEVTESRLDAYSPLPQYGGSYGSF